MMNPRADNLIKLASEYKNNPPTSNVKIIQRAAEILKIIYPDGSTFLRLNIDQIPLQIITPYLRYIEKALDIQLTYEKEVLIVKNLKENNLRALSDLCEKEKIIQEVEKRVMHSYVAMMNGLHIKLNKIIHLLEQKPVEVEMKKNISPKVVEKEIGEVEEKIELQPGR